MSEKEPLMDVAFLMALADSPDWKILRSEVIRSDDYQRFAPKLGSYDLVHVLVDEKGTPLFYKQNSKDVASAVIFTRPDLGNRISGSWSRDDLLLGKISLGPNSEINLKTMMLGELVNSLKRSSSLSSIKVNPVSILIKGESDHFLFCEKVLFAPQFDEFTQKLLLTDPEEAKALMAINPEDQKRFGMKMVFYMLTTRDLPEEKEAREAILKDRIEELAFIAPRTPIAQVSGSFLAVLLNLENEIEERAFIRDYPMFDEHSDLIFVTSALKLYNGALEEIHFNGDKIDTIFMPLISWQASRRREKKYMRSYNE
jgi:hypothetical protein